MARSPKVQRHHNHGSHASVPGKGKGPATPSQHWEMHYDPTPHGEAMLQGQENWDPMPGKARPHTHVKINDADH